MTESVLEAAATYYPEQKPMVEQQYRNKVRNYQIVMFTLCYLGYSVIHVYREFWSQSKPVIEKDFSKYHSDK